MERMSVLPYDWFNKLVRVEAYSGETTHPFASGSGIRASNRPKKRRVSGFTNG